VVRRVEIRLLEVKPLNKKGHGEPVEPQCWA